MGIGMLSRNDHMTQSISDFDSGEHGGFQNQIFKILLTNNDPIPDGVDTLARDRANEQGAFETDNSLTLF